jgi:hypothetical protein
MTDIAEDDTAAFVVYVPPTPATDTTPEDLSVESCIRLGTGGTADESTVLGDANVSDSTGVAGNNGIALITGGTLDMVASQGVYTYSGATGSVAWGNAYTATGGCDASYALGDTLAYYCGLTTWAYALATLNINSGIDVNVPPTKKVELGEEAAFFGEGYKYQEKATTTASKKFVFQVDTPESNPALKASLSAATRMKHVAEAMQIGVNAIAGGFAIATGLEPSTDAMKALSATVVAINTLLWAVGVVWGLIRWRGNKYSGGENELPKFEMDADGTLLKANGGLATAPRIRLNSDAIRLYGKGPVATAPYVTVGEDGISLYSKGAMDTVPWITMAEDGISLYSKGPTGIGPRFHMTADRISLDAKGPTGTAPSLDMNEDGIGLHSKGPAATAPQIRMTEQEIVLTCGNNTLTVSATQGVKINGTLFGVNAAQVNVNP